MEPRNLYIVLGVPPTETPAGIRHAFRELASRYHPDRVGAQGTPFFQDIVDAYRLLSDAQSRAAYHRELRRTASAAELPRRRPVQQGVRTLPESLSPQPVSLFRDFRVDHPSLEEVRERFTRSVTEPSFPKSQQLDALNLELLLPPERAAQGGTLDLTVPVFHPCRLCHGLGSVAFFECLGCDGRGMIADEEPVRVVVPAGVRDGTVIRIPLRGLGIPMDLRLHLRVGGARE